MTLVVKVEVHPGGDAERAERLGELRIINITGLAPVSSYIADLYGPDDGEPIAWTDVIDHRRAEGAWRLVFRALEALSAQLPPRSARIGVRRLPYRPWYASRLDSGVVHPEHHGAPERGLFRVPGGPRSCRLRAPRTAKVQRLTPLVSSSRTPHPSTRPTTSRTRTMRPPILAAEHRWRCPECLREHVTHRREPHTPLHQCPRLRGAWAPFVAAGVHARLQVNDRQDYVGRDLVTCDANGRPVMSITTHRNDGEDCTVFAPCATATVS